MPLDVGRLRVLVEVARAGSIAEAARRMAYTPSAVSQQLAKLETELQTRLVERTGAGVRLTEVGEVLVRHGERVLGELREAEAAARAAMGAGRRRLALGTFATAGAALVPGVLAELRARHPDADLTLLDLEPPDGYGLVTSGDLDLLITHRYPGVPAVPAQGLTRRPLLSDPLRLVLPVGHPLAEHPGPIPLADLRDAPWISGGAGVPNRVCLNTLASAAGFTPQIGYETRDYTLTLALIRANLGISLVPALVLSAPDGVVFRDLAGSTPTRLISMVHRRRPTSLANELIALLQAAAHTLRQPGDR
ncbi:LysR family transcriptional regulator [Actinocorallia aurea]